MNSILYYFNNFHLPSHKIKNDDKSQQAIDPKDRCECCRNVYLFEYVTKFHYVTLKEENEEATIDISNLSVKICE